MNKCDKGLEGSIFAKRPNPLPVVENNNRKSNLSNSFSFQLIILCSFLNFIKTTLKFKIEEVMKIIVSQALIDTLFY